jgi:predicted ribosomally synthesized peptide with nif11-like leader
MSANDAISFYTKLSTDSDLQEQLGAKTVGPAELGKRASEVGKTIGLKFTAAEFDATHAIMRISEDSGPQNEEISDEELEAVTGGKGSWWPICKISQHTKCPTCGYAFKAPPTGGNMTSQVDTLAGRLGG